MAAGFRDQVVFWPVGLGALVVAGASVTSLAVLPAVLGAVAYCAAGASALAIRWHRMGSLVSPLSSPQSQ